MVLAIRRYICPFPSNPTFSVVLGWEAVDGVFHAEPRGWPSTSSYATVRVSAQGEPPPRYLECWQNTSRGSFSFQGPLTDPGCPPLLHKIMYTFHLAADKVAPFGEGTQTVLIAIAWVCVILGSLWLLGLSPLDITGQHVDWAPGCRSASLTTSNPSSRALSAWAASRLLDKCLRGCQSPFSPRVACLFAAPVPTWV